MRLVEIPSVQLNVETNLRFSVNERRFGPPPRVVTIGSELRVEFADPSKLVGSGVYCDPVVVRRLVREVPGFRKIPW